MNFISALIACLSYTAITAFVYTVTYGLSRHLFIKIKIYYEIVLGIGLGFISVFGTIVLSLAMGDDKNYLLTILLPIFLFWTALLFISPFATIGVLACNMIALFLFPYLFPLYFGKIESTETAMFVAWGYSICIILYLIGIFWKKIDNWTSWSLITISLLVSGLILMMPKIKSEESANFLMTLMIWLGTGYLTYAYLSIINQIYNHALQLQNVVVYDHQYFLNQANAHEEILKTIQSKKIRHGFYLTYFISNYDLFEKKVSNLIREHVTTSIAQESYEKIKENFEGAVFFKPNYKTFGVFIPANNFKEVSDSESTKNIFIKIEKIVSSISSTFKVDKYKVSVKIKAALSIYGLNSNSLDTLFEFNRSIQNKQASELISTVTLVDPIEYLNERNRTKKILTLNEVVSLNHSSPIFEPIYDLKQRDFGYQYINHMVEGIEIDSNLFKEQKNLISEFGLTTIFTRFLALSGIKSIYRNKINDAYSFIGYDISYLSKKDFDIHEFLSKLKSYKINLSKLILTFDITIEVDDRERLEKNIQSLKEKGIKTAIQEFGSEKADYSLIPIYKPEYIFIEGNVIKKVNLIEENAQIVSNAIKIAKKIDAQVVATKVDTYIIFKALKEMGIELFMGHLIGSGVEPKLEAPAELGFLLNK
ncbi:hypothetical protein SCHIN_v1c01230 [Spiroplasma chinense]|uniref:EAL domain-containing protein n=1 Tax=Spiroplasma chinense TaxID=216932 RepID=A0A5B9Y2Y9_9MOLU|nr:EAL domain-containing protein [Spiroplasma chinense]QEH61321.1 hypothetical protein SCHIN_v1c01230 [Spiroplasma chinense]